MVLLLAMSPAVHAQLGTPSNLTVTSKSASAIGLSWTAATGSPSGYNVLRCVQGTGADCTPVYLAWSTNTTHSDSSVTANTRYRYAVQACSPCGNWSNQVLETAEAATAPGAPGGLTALASASKSALSWTAPSNTGNSALSSYTLYRGDGNSCSSLSALSLTIAASATSAEDTTVTANTTYCYQISASNSLGGEGSRSGSAVVTAVDPAAPTSLQVTSQSVSEIALSWTAPAADGGGAILGYNVYRCVQGTGANCTPTYEAWSTSTSHSDSSVTADTRYRYAVAAVRAGTTGNWSNEVAVTAAPPPPPSLGPPSLEVVSTSPTAIELSWTEPDYDGHGALSGYAIHRCEEESGGNLQNCGIIEETESTGTTYTDDSVTANTRYVYSVAAVRAGSTGNYSNDVTATAAEDGTGSGNTAPVFASDASIGDLVFTAGAAIEAVTLPGATGGDTDDGELSDYSIDPALPDGLEFDRFTRVLSGTPATAQEQTGYTYWVHDDDEDYARTDGASLSFTITVEESAGPEPVTPAAPAGLEVVSAGDTAIELRWTAPADDGNGALDGYNVFRCQEGEQACTPTYLDWVPLANGTAYTDDGRGERTLTTGIAYRYAVGAARGGERSDWSNEVTAKAETTAVPENSAPVFAAGAAIGDLTFTVGVAIEAVTLPGATGGDTDDGELSDYSIDPVLPDGLEFDRFTRVLSGTPSAVLAQAAYTYWVHDDDDDYARTDADSLSFTITIEEAAEPEPAAPAAPTGLTAVVSAAGITLSWMAPSGEIVGYSVYRCAQEDGGGDCVPEWKYWVANAGDAPPAPTTHLDDEVTVGTTYRYEVTANDADYRESRRSEQVTATAAPPPPVVLPSEVKTLEDISASMGRSMLASIIPTISRRFADAPNVSPSGLAGGKPEFARPLNLSNGNGPDWILWGAGDIQSFDDDAGGYDGDYKAAYLGLDAHIADNWIAGVTVSRGIGQAGYGNAEAAGDFELTMTTVLPYAQLRFNERHAVWMILGAGWGDAEHTNRTGIRNSGDASMRLGAFGARTRLGAGLGGVDWAAHGDVAYLQLDSLYDLSVGVSRARLGLESSSTFPVQGDAHIRPFVELNTRFDNGAGANNGAGIEFVGGARYAGASCGFWLEARGRVMVLHSAQDYQERGFSVSLGKEPCADGTGLSLLLAPQWGRPSGIAETLRGQRNFGWPGLRPESGRRGGSLRAEIGYSFVDPRFGGILTPFTGVDIESETRRSARLGAQYSSIGRSHELQIELSYGVAMLADLGHSAPGGEFHHEARLSGALRLLPPLRGLGLAGNTYMLAMQPQEGGENGENGEAEDAAIEEIVVTAKFQRSLREALDRKRQATEIIEALSAEEIGQLPDTSVAESLARLPGLAHTRNAFGANNLSIRGLGAVLTNGTLNGRDLASEWGDRSVSFNLFPAELVSRASIYKAPSAAHVEGGIGGTIDLQTARALEWSEQATVLNLRVRHNDLGGKLPEADSVSYRGSVTWIDQFLADTLGLAVGYAGQQAPLVSANSYIYESRAVEWGGFIEGLPDGFGEKSSFNIPYGAESNFLSGDGARHSLLTAIQWRPTDRFEFNLDGFYTDYEQEGGSHGVVLGGLGTFANAYDQVTADGFNLTGATVTCGREPAINCLERGYGQDLSALNAADNAVSDLQSYGAGVIWTADPLTLKYDFSYSRASGESEYITVQHRPYSVRGGEFALMRPIASFGENEHSAAFLTSPLDFSDPATNRIDGLRILEGEREDEIFTYRLDAEYALNTPFLAAVRGGLRIVNRDNTLVSRQNRVAPAEMDMPAAIDPRFVLTSFDQSRIDSAFQVNPILVLDAQAVQAAVFPDVRALVQPSGSHFIEEDVLATYLQADFEVEALFGIPAAGNFGVRAVTTDVDTAGTSSLEGVAERVTTSDKYTEILPSANLNLFPTDDLVVRLAASRVMARPAVTFLTPGTDQYSNQIFGGPHGGGNPYLRPFVADQLDLSVEYYFTEGSALAVALFYKEMDTFITQDRIESGPPDDTVSFIPANGSGGRVRGIEATFQHNFTNLLPAGYGEFGIYATYTRTDSSIRLTETFNSSTFGLDGQSDHLGNITLHYYRGGFAARFSYRYRSDFTRPQRPARAFTTNQAEGDLSFHFSYDVNERVLVALEGWNLLDEPRDNYYGLESLQGAYGIFGRSLQLGLTYRP